MGKDFAQADMSGALFKNERKTEGSDYPDYQGSVTVKGVKYALGAWLKKSKAGKTYMSISVRPWQSGNQQSKGSTTGPQNATPTSHNDDFQDDNLSDVPF